MGLKFKVGGKAGFSSAQSSALLAAHEGSSTGMFCVYVLSGVHGYGCEYVHLA